MRIPVESDVLMRTAARYSERAHELLATSVRHLSSGQRVTSAMDDASGLAIAQRMRVQYEGLLQAGRNAQEGLNFLGIADAALSRTTDMLQRIRVIAVQSASGTYTDAQRVYLQRTVDLTLDEIDAVAHDTEYNGMKVFDTSRGPWRLQVGVAAGHTMTIEVGPADRVGLGLGDTQKDTDAVVSHESGAPDELSKAQAAFVKAAATTPLSVLTQEAAAGSLHLLDHALTYVLAERADFGAASQRLEYLIRSLGASADAAKAVEARITDADIPAESATMLRAQIAAETSAQMMAQAHHAQALVLELLRPLRTPSPSAGQVGAAVATGPVAPAVPSPTPVRPVVEAARFAADAARTRPDPAPAAVGAARPRGEATVAAVVGAAWGGAGAGRSGPTASTIASKDAAPAPVVGVGASRGAGTRTTR